MSIVNIAAYKFVSLADTSALREHLLAYCAELALKGTILLAPEGINLFLAGARAAIDAFLLQLRNDARFADIPVRESTSATVPFGRLHVRLKQEIITMRHATIKPTDGRAPTVDAPTLQRWIQRGRDDAGRELVLLDTRNTYETVLGSFTGAITYPLTQFGDFPAAIATDHTHYIGKTIVPYCTGGIRCEKAALHMRELGLTHVYQLDGGILGYLEHTDGSGWNGDCFVFDRRIAVRADLTPTTELLRAATPTADTATCAGPASPATP